MSFFVCLVSGLAVAGGECRESTPGYPPTRYLLISIPVIGTEVCNNLPVVFLLALEPRTLARQFRD